MRFWFGILIIILSLQSPSSRAGEAESIEAKAPDGKSKDASELLPTEPIQFSSTFALSEFLEPAFFINFDLKPCASVLDARCTVCHSTDDPASKFQCRACHGVYHVECGTSFACCPSLGCKGEPAHSLKVAPTTAVHWLLERDKTDSEYGPLMVRSLLPYLQEIFLPRLGHWKGQRIKLSSAEKLSEDFFSKGETQLIVAEAEAAIASNVMDKALFALLRSKHGTHLLSFHMATGMFLSFYSLPELIYDFTRSSDFHDVTKKRGFSAEGETPRKRISFEALVEIAREIVDDPEAMLVDKSPESSHYDLQLFQDGFFVTSPRGDVLVSRRGLKSFSGAVIHEAIVYYLANDQINAWDLMQDIAHDPHRIRFSEIKTQASSSQRMFENIQVTLSEDLESLVFSTDQGVLETVNVRRRISTYEINSTTGLGFVQFYDGVQMHFDFSSIKNKKPIPKLLPAKTDEEKREGFWNPLIKILKWPFVRS